MRRLRWEGSTGSGSCTENETATVNSTPTQKLTFGQDADGGHRQSRRPFFVWLAGFFFLCQCNPVTHPLFFKNWPVNGRYIELKWLSLNIMYVTVSPRHEASLFPFRGMEALLPPFHYLLPFRRNLFGDLTFPDSMKRHPTLYGRWKEGNLGDWNRGGEQEQDEKNSQININQSRWKRWNNLSCWNMKMQNKVCCLWGWDWGNLGGKKCVAIFLRPFFRTTFIQRESEFHNHHLWQGWDMSGLVSFT